MGEDVVAAFEAGHFSLRGPKGVLLHVPLTNVEAEPIPEEPNTVALRARFGYSTELAFAERQLSSGTKFTPEQACDLFLETLAAFTAGTDKGKAVVGAAVASLRKSGQVQFEGKLANGDDLRLLTKAARGDAITITVDETTLLVKGEKSVLLKAPPGHVHVNPEGASASNVVLRSRQGTTITVTISEKKIPGVTKLTAQQARDIFIETIAAFGRSGSKT
jgi:hypothetical protein